MLAKLCIIRAHAYLLSLGTSLPTRAFAAHSVQTAALQCLIQLSVLLWLSTDIFSTSTSYRILMDH